MPLCAIFFSKINCHWNWKVQKTMEKIIFNKYITITKKNKTKLNIVSNRPFLDDEISIRIFVKKIYENKLFAQTLLEFNVCNIILHEIWLQIIMLSMFSIVESIEKICLTNKTLIAKSIWNQDNVLYLFFRFLYLSYFILFILYAVHFFIENLSIRNKKKLVKTNQSIPLRQIYGNFVFLLELASCWLHQLTFQRVSFFYGDCEILQNNKLQNHFTLSISHKKSAFIFEIREKKQI